MQRLNKQKYFYCIAFMLMASSFLPLVFNNLPGFIKSHHLWTMLWVVSLLLFYPKIFLDKRIWFLILYGFFLFFATVTIWENMDDWNYRSLFMELYEVGIGLLVVMFFYKTKDYIGLAKITAWSILFIIITAVMTIVSSAIDPMYARNLIGVSAVENESARELILNFKKYGGGNYSTAITFMSLLPMFIYFYKNFKNGIVSKKLIVVSGILIFVALIGMQLFANLLLCIIFSVLAIAGSSKMKKSISIVFLIVTIAVSISKEIYIDSFLYVSELFPANSELSSKCKDLAVFIEFGDEIEDFETGAGGRAKRYPMLFDVFVKSPIFGCYYFTDKMGNGYQSEGAHLHWMNKVTTTGIIGFALFWLIFYSFIKSSVSKFNSSYKYYYLLASFSIFSYGFLKTLGGRDAWYTLFVILPGIYYLPLLRAQN